MMETSMQNGIDSLRQSLNKSKEEERMIMGKCTYCGKQSGDALKSCSRCKLVLGKVTSAALSSYGTMNY